MSINYYFRYSIYLLTISFIFFSNILLTTLMLPILLYDKMVDNASFAHTIKFYIGLLKNNIGKPDLVICVIILFYIFIPFLFIYQLINKLKIYIKEIYYEFKQ